MFIVHRQIKSRNWVSDLLKVKTSIIILWFTQSLKVNLKVKYSLNRYFNLLYAYHYSPLLIRNRSWILTIHKARISRKKNLEKTFYDFKKWVKSIQTAGYNGNQYMASPLVEKYCTHPPPAELVFKTSQRLCKSQAICLTLYHAWHVPDLLKN